MFKMFSSSEGYVKTYSVGLSTVTEDCVAYTLLPYANSRNKLAILRIQFDFNVEGRVVNASFIYKADSESLLTIVQQTKQQIKALETIYNGASFYQQFDKDNNILTVFLPEYNYMACLNKLLCCVEEIYEFNAQIAQDVKEQLTNPCYLSTEYQRLFNNKINADIEKLKCFVM